MSVRLKEEYNKKVLPELIKKYSLKNRFMAPRIQKIVVNMGVGEAKENAKLLTTAVEEMTMITGQKPIITRARKSIAGTI